MRNLELRLTSGSRQDRRVNLKNYALTTDKSYETRRRYSLASRYNQTKREINKSVYWGLLQPHQRLMSEEMSGIGFKNVLTFNGAPVLIDSHQAANTMYFLNSEFLKLYVHSACDMKFEKVTQIEAQAAELGRFLWAGNLVCNGRRYQGSLSDLLTS